MRLAEICQHGKMVLSGGKPFEDCDLCYSKEFVNISFKERKHFNRGLGREFAGFYEAERWGKKHGFEPVGGENPRKIIEDDRKSVKEKQEKGIEKIIDGGRREIHNLGRI